MRRVVITGMGIYSCIGKNQDEVKDSLFQGRSGIGIDPARKEMGYFSALTGLVERPDLKKLLDRKKRHSLAEQGEYAYMATLEAFRQAQIDEEFLLDHEVGILYGNDSSAAPVIEAIDVIRAKKNTAMVGSGSIFQSMNSTITMNLSVIFHLKGINFRWVLSIPFFISCIRQQNPLTVLSKIILRKVKQFNLPPPKKMRDFCIF